MTDNRESKTAEEWEKYGNAACPHFTMRQRGDCSTCTKEDFTAAMK